MYSKKDIDVLCHTWGIGLKKRWGQNFLIDRHTTEDIVDLALSLVDDDAKPCTLWEIGPGFGALTRIFLQRACVKHLHVFEIDHGICKALESSFAQEIATGLLHIERGDAMSTMPVFHATSASAQLICGNLPYSMGLRLIIAISHALQFHVPLCIMVQKEAAERIAAPSNTKTYGVSSVILQSLYEVRVERIVPRSFFYPYAHVDSALCVLRPKNNGVVTRAYMNALAAIAKSAFSMRRKKLANTLVPYLRSAYGTEEMMHTVSINPSDRAENVPVDSYAALARKCVHKDDLPNKVGS